MTKQPESQRTMRNPRHKAAFTLIELLVVVSIVALLVSILLPALRDARQAAQTVKCLSNLRQCALAAHAYAADADGRYPIAYYHVNRPGLFISYTWDFTTRKDWQSSPPQTEVTPGLLWRYTDNGEVQQCPSFHGADNWLLDPYTGYNYNTSYIGHGTAESIPAPAKVTDVRHPAETALFGDGECSVGATSTSGGANKFMRAPWANPADAGFSGRFAGTQGYRHRRRTNVALCDGHARSWPHLYTDTYPTDRANLETYNRTARIPVGFLSPDNSLYDLK